MEDAGGDYNFCRNVYNTRRIIAALLKFGRMEILPTFRRVYDYSISGETTGVGKDTEKRRSINPFFFAGQRTELLPEALREV